MKNGKKLTLAQKELLTRNGYNYRDYLRVKDLPHTLLVVHRITGRYEIIKKD